MDTHVVKPSPGQEQVPDPPTEPEPTAPVEPPVKQLPIHASKVALGLLLFILVLVLAAAVFFAYARTNS